MTHTSKVRREPTPRDKARAEAIGADARVFIVDPASSVWAGIPDDEPEWECRKCGEPSGYSFLCKVCWQEKHARTDRECVICGEPSGELALCEGCLHE